METFKFLMTPEEEKYVSRGAKLFKDMPKPGTRCGQTGR